jgi:hypothetical protein
LHKTAGSNTHVPRTGRLYCKAYVNLKPFVVKGLPIFSLGLPDVKRKQFMGVTVSGTVAFRTNCTNCKCLHTGFIACRLILLSVQESMHWHCTTQLLPASPLQLFSSAALGCGLNTDFRASGAFYGGRGVDKLQGLHRLLFACV